MKRGWMVAAVAVLGFIVGSCGAGPPATGRYVLAVTGPMVVRMDAETGRAWRYSLSGDAPWTPIPEPTPGQ